MNEIVLGSLSSGTMRKQDLIPILAEEILRLDDKNEVANKVWDNSYNLEGDRLEEYWESEDSGWDLDDLFDELNDIANLPYVSFGSHPDDGADYGYWVDWESLYLDSVRGGVTITDNPKDMTDENQMYLLNSNSLYEGNKLLWSVE